MSMEVMVTRAILEDGFTPVLNRIAGAQDEFSQRSSKLNAAGNILLTAGSAALAFGVKSIKVAGQIDEINKAMTAVEGAQKAAFDLDYAQKYALASKQTYLDIGQAAQSLVLHQMDVKTNLKDIADLAAASGRPLMDAVNLYERLQAGRTGTGLGQMGIARFGISTAEVFAEAGLPYKQGQKVQGKIDPQAAIDAIHRILAKRGYSGMDKKLSTTTISGSASMIEDAVTHLQNSIGSGKLEGTIHILNEVAGGINHIADAIKNVPGAGDKYLAGTVGLLAAGGIAKGVFAWRQHIAILKTAAAAGALERAGEAAKPALAGKEADAITNVTTKYGGLAGKLETVGRGALGLTGETVTATTAMSAGAVAAGLWAVALVGVVVVIAEVVGALKELGVASTNVEEASQANRDAIKSGYEFKQSQVTGAAKKSVFHQYWDSLQDVLWNRADDDSDKAGSTAIVDKDWFKRKHGMAPGGLRAQQVAAQQLAQQKTQDEAKQSASDAANSYTLPADLEYKIKHDERALTLLKDTHATQKAVNDAKAVEVAHLMKAHDLLLANAKLATDDKAKYKLLNEAEEYAQKARIAKITDKRDMMDKTIATILGGGGVSEDDILKRAGIGRRFFRSMGSAGVKAAADPLKAALHTAARTPMVINLQLDGKTMQTIKTETTNEAFNQIIHFLETSGTGRRLGAQN